MISNRWSISNATKIYYLTISRDNLMDTSPDTFSGYPADSYHPYPTQSSFLLGEWYWNGGLKKTQSGFRDLIKIVGHPSF